MEILAFWLRPGQTMAMVDIRGAKEGTDYFLEYSSASFSFKQTEKAAFFFPTGPKKNTLDPLITRHSGQGTRIFLSEKLAVDPQEPGTQVGGLQGVDDSATVNENLKRENRVKVTNHNEILQSHVPNSSLQTPMAANSLKVSLFCRN